MNVYLRIGDNRTFALKRAVLLYEDGSRAFATLHEIQHRSNEAPYSCAGQTVTSGFLETLAKGLGASMAAEVLPDHVLARTPGLDCMVEPGATAVNVLRRWEYRDQGAEREDVSPPRSGLHDPRTGIVRARAR